MIPIGVGIGAAALAVAGTVALGAVLLAPPPPSPVTVWVDQPIHGAELLAGVTTVGMHASADRSVRQFRLTIMSKGEVVAVLNDTTPDTVSFGFQASPLVSGSVDWDALPGTYKATVSYLDTVGWVTGVPVSVTVLDGTPVMPFSPGTIPVPGKPDDSFEPEPVPSFDPIPDAPQPGFTPAPMPTSAPPTSGPTAAPSQPPTPPSTPPAGTVRRTVNGTSTVFVAEGVQPQNAIVDVQYQVTNDYNGAANPSGTWTSMGCGNLTAQAGTSPTKYTCTTAAWVVPGRSSGYRTGHVRVQVTSGGSTWTSYGPDWLIEPNIN